MTFNSFIDQYTGRFVEFADPKNLYQCVDLMRTYIKQVWMIPPYSLPIALYAKDIYKNFKPTTTLQKIDNKPSNMPQKGDIMFFGYYWGIFGWAGHVGIVQYADLYKVVLFNQNYPTGSPCGMRQFSYKGALGWVHKK